MECILNVSDFQKLDGSKYIVAIDVGSAFSSYAFAVKVNDIIGITGTGIYTAKCATCVKHAFFLNAW